MPLEYPTSYFPDLYLTLFVGCNITYPLMLCYMYLKLFDVSTCNSVDIQCTGIACRYITGLWRLRLETKNVIDLLHVNLSGRLFWRC